jgi:low affinity Fe/Cu permease
LRLEEVGVANQRHAIGLKFEALSEAARRWTGTTAAFLMAAAVIVVWALLGPLFNYSATWQLVINTGTTIVTFLMVFLIQRSQNKDALAIHVKLNELVAAMEGASNRVIDVEALSEKELATLECYYREVARLARSESDITKSHSVEDARTRHSTKKRGRRTPLQ